MQVGSSRSETSGNESSPVVASGDPVASLGGSITVWLWSFMHTLRGWVAKSARKRFWSWMKLLTVCRCGQ